METEIWKDIPGYEGLYQISSEGIVRSFDRIVKSKGGSRKVKGRIIENRPNINTGYMIIPLWKENKCWSARIHRLVAQAFLGLDINSNMVVCHKNDLKTDNRIENLFVGTQKENNDDKLRKRRHIFGKKHKLCKLSEESVKEIREYCKGIRGQQAEMARKFNVNPTLIMNIVKRKTWNHI